ncbi:RepB family plasmid replication initiator protein, partial [Acinetobacter sp. 11520]|nr:RepB family plasmid replication initiator protein [Acinetobacter sp. 11520]
NDIMFQMDFAVAGSSMSEFKKEMKYKLKNNPNFVKENRKRLNEIFGKDVI